MLSVEILGGVGEYGRNCFYIENQRQAILLDCGIMKDTQKRHQILHLIILKS